MGIDRNSEQIRLAEASVDAVFAAEAFNLFKSGRALVEIAGVLRPSAWVRLLSVRADPYRIGGLFVANAEGLDGVGSPIVTTPPSRSATRASERCASASSAPGTAARRRDVRDVRRCHSQDRFSARARALPGRTALGTTSLPSARERASCSIWYYSVSDFLHLAALGV